MKKQNIIIISVFFFLFLSLFNSCKKDKSSVTLTPEERRLLGKWSLKRTIQEQPGQALQIFDPASSTNCYINFKEDADYIGAGYPFLNSSPLYANTKQAEDHKDCSFLYSAWKIETTGKLLLVSVDTVYADVVFVSNDSLVIKREMRSNPGRTLTYQFRK